MITHIEIIVVNSCIWSQGIRTR